MKHTREDVAPAAGAAENVAFASLLTSHRQRAGLSQGQLALASRLSRTYIYHLERGQRARPSAHATRALARALELRGTERQAFYDAVADLTGEPLAHEDDPEELFELSNLTELLVASSPYPAHGLDRLYHISFWNDAAVQLFDVEETFYRTLRPHLLSILFDPLNRARFRPWEPLARRMVADFKWNTATLTHLPEYRALWRDLRALPDFRRIADVTPAMGVPIPTFVMTLQHPRLGPLALRTATTQFGSLRDHRIVTYVPGDARTLDAFGQMRWHAYAPAAAKAIAPPDEAPS